MEGTLEKKFKLGVKLLNMSLDRDLSKVFPCVLWHLGKRLLRSYLLGIVTEETKVMELAVFEEVMRLILPSDKYTVRLEFVSDLEMQELPAHCKKIFSALGYKLEYYPRIERYFLVRH